jgi:hypothetical protein
MCRIAQKSGQRQAAQRMPITFTDPSHTTLRTPYSV